MTDNLATEINQLKTDIFSEDWDIGEYAANRLVEIGGDAVVEFLISLLELDNSKIRHKAALALRDIKDNRAVEPLLQSIFKKENHNYNSSMVYALKELDCSRKLKEIFKILFYESWAAKQHGYLILSEQTFTFPPIDILEIINMWNDIKLHPNKCPDYDRNETREMIQDVVDGYKGYYPASGKDKKNENV